MKRALFILMAFLTINMSYATKIIAIANTGNGWSVPANWNLNRIPSSNDTAIIPAGLQMNIKGSVYSAPFPNIVTTVAGVLFFEPSGRLDFGVASKVAIDIGGSINSTGSPSELIRINGVVKYNGDIDGLVEGPATADRFTLVTPYGFVFSILPLKFELFTAAPEAGKVKLQFKISNDVKIDRIAIEKSNDGRRWNTVIEKTFNRRRAEANVYDPSPLSANTAYYRLLVFETNALVSISNVIAVHPQGADQAFQIYYNQQTGDLNVKLNARQPAEHLAIKVINESGQVITAEVLDNHSKSWALHLTHPKHGLYFVVIYGEHHFLSTYRLLL